MHKSFWLLIFAFISVQPAYSDSTIIVSDAWINEAPPMVKVLAGYMTIQNHSGEPVNLTGTKSPDFERIEFHLTTMNDGVASMQKQDEITIAPNSEFSFSPGAYHLMLFNPERTLKSEDMVQLDMIFSSGETISIEAVVRRGKTISHDHH